MKIESGSRIIFIGDSITDCGRSRPSKANEGLGEGYVALVENFLSAWYPERRIEVFNTGIGGNRITDLKQRWQTDVLDYNPDWVAIKIGINDVWRQFDSPGLQQVDIETYELIYRELLKKTCPDIKGLVILSPYLIEPDRTVPMRALMDRYSSTAELLAAEFGAFFVDVQAEMDRYLKYRKPISLSTDRIHPNRTGHLLIARAFLKALAFEWE